MRILYVEDKPANLFLIKRVARGHEVVNYIDAEEALAHFDRDNPDVVMVDVQLAGPMSGLDLVKQLRANGHKLPIVALTAYAMVGDREKCLTAGCDDYMAKPLPIARFLELIQKYEKIVGSTQTAPSVPAASESAAPAEAEAKPEAIKPPPDATEVMPRPVNLLGTADKDEKPQASAAPAPEKPTTADISADVAKSSAKAEDEPAAEESKDAGAPATK
jgi:CheY-like chemotaxis protein